MIISKRTFKVKNKTKKDCSPDKMTVIYIFHAYKRTKNTKYFKSYDRNLVRSF